MDDKKETKEKLPWNERFLEFVDGKEDHPSIWICFHGFIVFILYWLEYELHGLLTVITPEMREQVNQIYKLLTTAQHMELILLILAISNFIQKRKQKKKAQKEAKEPKA